MEWKSISVAENAAFTLLRDTLARQAPTKFDYLGNLNLLKLPSVGFCGSRRATDVGLVATRDCASVAVAAGLVVVSGNATGVDFAAHRTALENGGHTILVLPEGISRFRVKSDLKDVWDWERALVLSQWDSVAIWRSYQAMTRNLTIIGLAGALVVIEAGITGGTKHAGESALNLSVPLFVLEYRHVLEDRAGNAELIARGGVPIRRKRDTGAPSLDRLIKAAYERYTFGGIQGRFEL